MLHFNNQRVYVQTFVGTVATIWSQVKNGQISSLVLFGLLACGSAYAQTPIPSPSPAPTPITKTGSILVANPSSVGRISKWLGSSNNGIGTIGDSVIIESSIGTIGIGTNPFADFRLGVDGGNTISGGVFGSSSVFNGTGLRGRALHPNSGTGVSGFGTTGLFGQTLGNNPNGNNIGVWGVSANSSGIGVRGLNTAGGLAGKFDGDVAIIGNLSVTGTSNLTATNSIHANTADTASNAANANAVTNGVYTTGSYANPSWITSLAGSKITGAVVNEVNGLSGAVTLAGGDNVTLSPSGNTLTISVDTVRGFNPLQIATLRWYNANEAGLEFSVGVQPQGLAFDGANIWVANWGANTVSKLRANDGVSLGTFSAGNSPQRVAFDGANVWVTNSTADTVTKLRATDGTVLGTFTVGDYPQDVAFDGTNIWVSNYLDNTVTKLKANDGSVINTFSVGQGPNGVAFDGTNVWVGSQDNKVTKLRAVDGVNLGEFPTGDGPTAIAFDGSSIWISNSGSANVTKRRASDGMLLGTYPVGSYPIGIAFDGTNVWVASFQSNTVTKLRVSDGALLGTFNTGANSVGVAFDGINIWVSNYGSNTISKR